MAVLFPFANVGRISPIITHCADYVELFMRTYIGIKTVAAHNMETIGLGERARVVPGWREGGHVGD